MSDENEAKPVDVLEAQIGSLSDTHKNLAGLIEKVVRIQSDLATAEFQSLSDRIGEPFSAMSTAADALQAPIHDAELERNRIRNED